MSRFIGRSNVVRNQAAVHHAQTVRQVQHQTIQQNLRMQRMNRQLLHQLVEDVANTSVEEIEHLAEAVQEARQAPDPAAALADVGSESPFAWLLKYMPDPDNKMELYTFITLLLAAIMLVHDLMNGSPKPPLPAPSISPEQVEDITKRLIEHQEREHHKYAPAPEPACEVPETKETR